MNDVVQIAVNNNTPKHRWGAAGVTSRVAGTPDWSIVVTQKAQGDAAPDPADGAIGTVLVTLQASGQTWSGTAIASVTQTTDPDTGAPVENVYTFEAAGTILTPADGSASAGVYSGKAALVTFT